MAMNQSDQIEALTRLMVAMHRRIPGVRPKNLMLANRREYRQVAKMTGTTVEAVRAWERGLLEPTTTQALTWLSVVHTRADQDSADG